MPKLLSALVASVLVVASCASADVTAGQTSTDEPIETPIELRESPLALADELEGVTTTTEEKAVATTTTEGVAHIDVDAVLRSVARIGSGQSTITVEVEGEFDGEAYTTKETVVSDPQESRVHVSLEFGEFSDLIDSLVPGVLEAERASGAEEQGFMTTLLLVLSQSADSGEYIEDGEIRWQLATNHAQFHAILTALPSMAEDFSEEAKDLSTFGESLEGMWLGAPIRENESPAFLGLGPLLPEYLLQQLAGLGANETMQITDQQIVGDRFEIAVLTASGDEILFELDGSMSTTSIEFEADSRWLGSAESHTVTIENEADGAVLVLPPEEKRIDEAEFAQLLEAEMATTFPEAYAAAQ